MNKYKEKFAIESGFKKLNFYMFSHAINKQYFDLFYKLSSKFRQILSPIHI